MDDIKYKLIKLLECYLQDINDLSEKFSNEFHIIQREGINDQNFIDLFEDLSDKAPRFSPRIEDKNVWIGYISAIELLESTSKTKQEIDQYLKNIS